MQSKVHSYDYVTIVKTERKRVVIFRGTKVDGFNGRVSVALEMHVQILLVEIVGGTTVSRVEQNVHW